MNNKWYPWILALTSPIWIPLGIIWLITKTIEQFLSTYYQNCNFSLPLWFMLTPIWAPLFALWLLCLFISETIEDLNSIIKL